MFSPFIYFEGVIAQPIRARVAGVSEITSAVTQYAQAYLTEYSGALKQAYSSERQNADLAGEINYDKSRQVGGATLTLERYQGRETITVTLPPPSAARAERVSEVSVVTPAVKQVEGAQEVAEARALALEEPVLAREEEGVTAPPVEPEVEAPQLEAPRDQTGGPVFVIVLPTIFLPMRDYLVDAPTIAVSLGNRDIQAFSTAAEFAFDDAADTNETISDAVRAEFEQYWVPSTRRLVEMRQEYAVWFEQFDAFWQQLRAQFPTAPVVFIAEPEWAATTAYVDFAQAQRTHILPRLSALNGVTLSTADGYAEVRQAAADLPAPSLAAVLSPTTPYFAPIWPQLASSALQWSDILNVRSYSSAQFQLYARVTGYNPPPASTLDNDPDAGLPQTLFRSSSTTTYPIFEPVTMLPARAATDPFVVGIFRSPGWEFGDQSSLPEGSVLSPDIWNQVYDVAASIYSANRNDGIAELDGSANPTAVYLDRFKQLYAQLPGTRPYPTRNFPALRQYFFEPQPYLNWTRVLQQHIVSATEGGSWVAANIHIFDFNLREATVWNRWPSLSSARRCYDEFRALRANVTVAAFATAYGSMGVNTLRYEGVYSYPSPVAPSGARGRPLWDFYVRPNFEAAQAYVATLQDPLNAMQVMARQPRITPPPFELLSTA